MWGVAMWAHIRQRMATRDEGIHEMGPTMCVTMGDVVAKWGADNRGQLRLEVRMTMPWLGKVMRISRRKCNQPRHMHMMAVEQEGLGCRWTLTEREVYIETSVQIGRNHVRDSRSGLTQHGGAM